MKITVNTSKKSSDISGASLASMIDIIFLLIIFFIVTASFDNVQTDSSVKLPKVSNQVPIKDLPEKSLIINVLKNGEIRIGFEHIQAELLSAKLPALLSAHKVTPKTTIILNGDKNTQHRYIAATMDILAKRGLEKVQINALIDNKFNAVKEGEENK